MSAYRRSELLPKETPLAIRILISTVVPLRRTFTIAKRERAPAKPPAYYLWCSNHKVNVLAQVGAELSPIKDATWKLRHRQRGQQAQHDGRARPADLGLRELAPVLFQASLASPLSPKVSPQQLQCYIHPNHGSSNRQPGRFEIVVTLRKKTT